MRRHSKPVALLLLGAGLVLSLQSQGWCRTFDMTAHWDDKVPLKNPHKGWYHHLLDNHLTMRYPVAKDSDLLEFPGMDHLYLRLAWAYLEPEEGRFDWPIIDRIIEKWTAAGFGIAFRISCRETGTDRVEQQYATPRWVIEAGAQGGHYLKGKRMGPEGPWEPAYNDPVYLEKLERFLRVFAGRYDGKPWLRYVDVGSIGDWGEGHTSSGSQMDYGYDQRKVHVDLHLKYFQKTQIVISDDFVYGIRNLQDRLKMHRYILENGITYRDDSILVGGYLKGYSDTYTVRSPEFFSEVWQVKPTVLELQHYGSIKRNGNWLGRSDSFLEKYAKGKTGADFFRGAIDLLHATYIGYHGYAHEWLSENPDLTVELLNRCGYWYFLHRFEVPDVCRVGTSQTVSAVWENRGIAPAYSSYQLILRLQGPDTVDLEMDSGNRRWIPVSEGMTYSEDYEIEIPKLLKPGRYVLKLKLYSKEEKREVFLALDPKLLDESNFCAIGKVTLAK